MGELCEKSDFSPWKNENTYTFSKNLKKKFGLTRNGGEGGVQNMEKYFFAFLDELDHLEAEKKY